MKILTKAQMLKMPPGTVFCEYQPDIILSDIMVIDENFDIPFGATNVVPLHGEVFDWDWSINDYDENDSFMVFDNNDILQMIQTLTKGLNIELKEE